MSLTLQRGALHEFEIYRTTLDASTLNPDYKINRIHFIWYGEDPIPPQRDSLSNMIFVLVLLDLFQAPMARPHDNMSKVVWVPTYLSRSELTQ
jgi:hypothetical protein